MNINYSANNYNEAFKEIVSFNKDYNGLPHNIKPYINHRLFKSSYRIYVFDTRYQSNHIGPQPVQLNFKFSAAVADVICHALVLTRKVIRVNSDGNKMVDIVSIINITMTLVIILSLAIIICERTSSVASQFAKQLR